MDIKFKEDFIVLWKKFFGEAELPIVFYYTNEEGHAELVKPDTIARRCVIAALSLVRKGRALCFDAESIGCLGGQEYLGLRETDEPDERARLVSSGIREFVEGERYMKTVEIAAEVIKLMPSFKAPARFIVFKRWDSLNESDEPDVVIFFACPDVLSGLFALANFDETEPNYVFTPVASGCGSIVLYPFLEKDSVRPRAVIGLFDVSARPYVPENTLSFSVSMRKFERMVRNMEESFLTTNSWKVVQKRIQGAP
jgi:uncharacterized protein (DUF169 family)